MISLSLSYTYLGNQHHQNFRTCSLPAQGDPIRLYHNVTGEEATLDFIASANREWEFSSIPQTCVEATQTSVDVRMDLGAPTNAVPE